jgi:hypothetical protein
MNSYARAIGYKIVTLIGHPPMPNVYTESVDFQHASSDWSPTQTFTMPATSAFPSPSPTVPELPTLAAIPLLVGGLLIAVIIKHRKSTNLSK